MTKDDIIRRGTAAAQILDSGLFNDLRKAIDDTCCDQWLSSDPENTALREDLYRMARCHKDYVTLLNAWKGEAQVEVHKLEQARRDAGSTQF